MTATVKGAERIDNYHTDGKSAAVVLKMPVIIGSYSERAVSGSVKKNILSLRLVGRDDSKGALERSY